jgi:hypothetical protein
VENVKIGRHRNANFTNTFIICEEVVLDYLAAKIDRSAEAEKKHTYTILVHTHFLDMAVILRRRRWCLRKLVEMYKVAIVAVGSATQNTVHVV